MYVYTWRDILNILFEILILSHISQVLRATYIW